jgi:hypothetical protein
MSSTRTSLLIPRTSILDLGNYERRRDEIRPAAIAARKLRSVALGPNATLAFENRETLTYQVQEMLRAERIAKEPEVRHEIETYSELLPTSSSLSATLLIEFPDKDERAVRLVEMLGLDKHLRIEIEDAGSAHAEFDQRQIDQERLSSVQFVRFHLDSLQREKVSDGATMRVVCDHPKYAHAVDIPAEMSAALANDLRAAAEMEA